MFNPRIWLAVETVKEVQDKKAREIATGVHKEWGVMMLALRRLGGGPRGSAT
jgi:hypothetical protein